MSSPRPETNAISPHRRRHRRGDVERQPGTRIPVAGHMSSESQAPDPFHDGLPRIEGRRLSLRSFAPDDRDDVFRLYADEDAVRFGFAPPMKRLSDAEALIAETHRRASSRSLFHWGVARRDDDVIVGHATLLGLAPAHHRAEIGYSIERACWGRGLGTEAVGVLLGFAFEHLSLRRVEADVDPRNVASLRVLEKHGFRREGFIRQRWELAGELQDAVFLGLLRDEWTPL